MNQEQYIREIMATVAAVQAKLQAQGYNVSFGGEGPIPTRRPIVPTEARSEFLANRALGDWAEKTLAAAIRRQIPGVGVAHYGESSSISAGDNGFSEFYLARLEQVRKFGKRPDLLLFRDTSVIASYPDHDISNTSFEVLDSLARNALCAIEVRSSKVEALTYMSARQLDIESKRASSGTRIVPSFTVKIEDLVIVYRWLERYRISQTYCQVFFDSVWAINVLDIFKWIAASNFKVDNPDKSQGKATILLPITQGQQVGTFTKVPSLRIEAKVTRLGRHDSYIAPVFEPGTLELDIQCLKQILLP